MTTKSFRTGVLGVLEQRYYLANDSSKSDHASYVTAWNESAIGGDFAQYKKAIHEGRDATNAYTADRRRCHITPGYISVDVWKDSSHKVRYNDVHRTGVVDAQACSFGTLDPSLDTVATNAALSSFYHKAKRVQTQFQSGVFAGEFKETLHLLRNPGQALRRGLSDYLASLKKGRLGRMSLRRATRYVRETYLEYAFGWTPLINDVSNAAIAMGRLLNERPETKRVSGYGKNEVFIAQAPIETTALARWVMHTFKSELRGTYVRISGGVKAVPTPTGAGPQYLSPMVGATLPDVLPTLWELLPYSFIVDWFTNLGDIIAAECFVDSQIYYTVTTTKRRTSLRKIVRGNGQRMSDLLYGKLLINARVQDYVAYTVWTQLARSPGLPGNGIPTFQWSLPGLSTKWISLGSLVDQARDVHPQRGLGRFGSFRY